MKEYLLIDGSTNIYTLAPVTARNEKTLRELGIDKKDAAEADKLLREWTDNPDERIVNFCNVIFRGEKIKKEDSENLIKTVIWEGYLDFFLGELKLMTQYGDSYGNLISLQMQTMQNSKE